MATTSNKKTTRRKKAATRATTDDPAQLKSGDENAAQAAGAPLDGAPTLVPGQVTLGDLASGYCAHLESIGKSATTVRSYYADMRLACSVLGEAISIDNLTVQDVAEYFEHERVTHTRDGRPKAASGREKHRRVLRQALVWAAEQGHIDKAPIPAADAE